MTDSGTTKEMDLSAPIYSKPSPLGEVFHLIFAELHNKTIGTKKKQTNKQKQKQKIETIHKTLLLQHINMHRYFNYASLLKSADEKKKQPYNISLALSLCMSSP